MQSAEISLQVVNQKLSLHVKTPLSGFQGRIANVSPDSKHLEIAFLAERQRCLKFRCTVENPVSTVERGPLGLQGKPGAG